MSRARDKYLLDISLRKKNVERTEEKQMSILCASSGEDRKESKKNWFVGQRHGAALFTCHMSACDSYRKRTWGIVCSVRRAGRRIGAPQPRYELGSVPDPERHGMRLLWSRWRWKDAFDLIAHRKVLGRQAN